MPEILRQVARTYFHFWPSNVAEVCALYLAKILDDETSVRAYVSIVASYPSPMIKAALPRVLAKLDGKQSPITLLRDELLTMGSSQEDYE